MKRKRLGIAVLISVLLGLLAYRIFRQEVGDRASPLGSSALVSRAALDSPRVSRRDPRGVRQVWIPAGPFRQGAGLRADCWAAKADETPQRTVEITRGLWLDETEVTNADFDAFVADGGYDSSAY